LVRVDIFTFRTFLEVKGFVEFWSGKKRSKWSLSSLGSKLFGRKGAERRRIEEILGELSLISREVDEEFSAILDAVREGSEELASVASLMGAPIPSFRLEDPESILEEAERLLVKKAASKPVELELIR